MLVLGIVFARDPLFAFGKDVVVNDVVPAAVEIDGPEALGSLEENVAVHERPADHIVQADARAPEVPSMGAPEPMKAKEL